MSASNLPELSVHYKMNNQADDTTITSSSIASSPTSSSSSSVIGARTDKSTHTVYYRLTLRVDDFPSLDCDHSIVYDSEEKLMGGALRNVISFIGSGGDDGKSFEEIVEAFRDRSFFVGKTNPLFARTIALFDYVLEKLPEILALLTQGEVVEIFRKEKEKA